MANLILIGLNIYVIGVVIVFALICYVDQHEDGSIEVEFPVNMPKHVFFFVLAISWPLLIFTVNVSIKRNK